MCVNPLSLKGDFFPSSIALTNGAIWPLQTTGSSNIKSGVYGFEVLLHPSPLTDHRVKKNNPLNAYLMILDGRALRPGKVYSEISIFSRDGNVTLKEKRQRFSCCMCTQVFWLASRLQTPPPQLFNGSSHRPFCQSFLQSTCLYVREIEYFFTCEKLWSREEFSVCQSL